MFDDARHGKSLGSAATHSSRRAEIPLHVSVNSGGGGRGELKEGMLSGGAQTVNETTKAAGVSRDAQRSAPLRVAANRS